MHSFLKSLPDFLRSPRKPLPSVGTPYLYGHLLWLSILSALTLSLAMVHLVYPLLAGDIAAYVRETGSSTSRLPPGFFWSLPVLAFAEEVLFRLKFVSNTPCFVLGNWAFWNLFIVMFAVFGNQGEITEAITIGWINFSLLSGCAVLGVWLIFPGIIRTLRQWQERYLGPYLVFSALVFGWIHILNYEYASIAPWPAWIGLILPQVFLGLVFAWICIHKSFWHAWLFHTLYNLVLFVVSVLGQSLDATNASSLSLGLVLALALTLVVLGLGLRASYRDLRASRTPFILKN